MDGKPTTITAAEFVANDYAAKIKAGECVIRRLDCADYILEAMPYSQKGWIKLVFCDGWTAVEENDVFLVTWLPQPVIAQADAQTVGTMPTVEAGDNFYVKMAEDAVKLGNSIRQLKADHKTKLDNLRDENKRLRAALEPFARTYQTWLERPNTDVVFVDWLKAHLGKNTGAAYRHFRAWFAAAAAALSGEGA